MDRGKDRGGTGEGQGRDRRGGGGERGRGGCRATKDRGRTGEGRTRKDMVVDGGRRDGALHSHVECWTPFSAYLQTCMLAHMDTCKLAYLDTCKLGELHTWVWRTKQHTSDDTKYEPEHRHRLY